MSVLINKSLGEDGMSEKSQSVLTHNADVSALRPTPERTPFVDIKGVVANGTHGAFVTPLSFQEVLAGSEVSTARLRTVIRMEPLAHVNWSKLDLNVMAVFVPNSRVWDDYDEFMANRDDVLTAKKEVPAFNPTSANVLKVVMPDGIVQDARETTLYREMVIHGYYGKYQYTAGTYYNALPVRGYVAAYNDIFREKRVSSKIPEFKGDMSDAEYNTYFRLGRALNTNWQYKTDALTDNIGQCSAGYLFRAPSNKNYWTNYHMLAGQLGNNVDNTNLHTHNVTQRMIDEYRLSSENVNKTDAEVIAEIRGTAQARENECQIIGRNSVDIDMAILTASNENDNIRLGDEGAISYTFANIDIPINFRPLKDGYIHYLYWVSFKDGSLFTDVQNVEVKKRKIDDFYRPTLSEHKDLPILREEIGGVLGQNAFNIIGYRRRFAEYFRLPTCVRGDFLVTPNIEGSTPVPGFRLAGGGFLAPPTSWQQGSDTPSVPSSQLATKSEFTALRNRFMSDNIGQAENNIIDYSDYLIRRFLLVRGVPENNVFVFRLQTPQTFSLYGELSVSLSTPISPEIAGDLIRYADE